MTLDSGCIETNSILLENVWCFFPQGAVCLSVSLSLFLVVTTFELAQKVTPESSELSFNPSLLFYTSGSLRPLSQYFAVTKRVFSHFYSELKGKLVCMWLSVAYVPPKKITSE